MRPYPLGATKDDASAFPLDRSMGLLVLALFAARYVLTAWLIAIDPRRLESVTLFDYLAHSWWMHARYVAETATEFWLGIGLTQGRRWGMVGLLLLYFAWLGTAVHSLVTYGVGSINLGYLLVDSLVLVYAGMRLSGSLGPTPRPQKLENTSYFPDRIAAYVDFVFLGISLVLVVRSNVNAYHQAQDMGSIKPLAYLASRWWVHARWLFETILEAWTIVAIARSRTWALVLMALLSVGWLFGPIHTLNLFYIVTNGSMLAYCLVRLTVGPTLRGKVEPAIVSG